MTVIAHISDLHISKSTFDEDMLIEAINEINSLNPDMVIFAIGVNDASGKNFSQDEFISRYKVLISKVRAVNPDCALLFVSNNDTYKRVRRRVYAVNRNGLEAQEAFFVVLSQIMPRDLNRKHQKNIVSGQSALVTTTTFLQNAFLQCGSKSPAQ